MLTQQWQGQRSVVLPATIVGSQGILYQIAGPRPRAFQLPLRGCVPGPRSRQTTPREHPPAGTVSLGVSALPVLEVAGPVIMITNHVHLSKPTKHGGAPMLPSPPTKSHHLSLNHHRHHHNAPGLPGSMHPASQLSPTRQLLYHQLHSSEA